MTGATGFIGSALLNGLGASQPWDVRGTIRRPSANTLSGPGLISVGDLSQETDWHKALSGANAVVHTAGRVHVMDKRGRKTMSDYRRVNVDATLNLARQAVVSGARRFVFLSSIKVNGEWTPLDRPFTADDRPRPSDAYAVSKHEAEEGLRQIGNETGLEVVIIRPVLVYGPGVRANFLSMMQWLDRGVPLPFGAIRNARSLVALANLVDLIKTCLSHPAAASQTFLVSDGEDLSTPDLLRRTAAALGQRARLVSVPEFVIRSAAAMVRRPSVAERLCGSLRVDIAKNQRLLGWTPPVSVDEALNKTARYFLERIV